MLRKKKTPMTVHSSGKQPWNSVEGRTHRWPPGHHACWAHPPGLSLAGGPAFPSRVQCIWWCGLPGWATKSLAAPSKLLDVLPGEAGEHVTTQLPRDCCSVRKPKLARGQTLHGRDARPPPAVAATQQRHRGTGAIFSVTPIKNSQPSAIHPQGHERKSDCSCQPLSFGGVSYAAIHNQIKVYKRMPKIMILLLLLLRLT